MRDPGNLYQVSPDAPELDDVTMLYYFDGFIDAGGGPGSRPNRAATTRAITLDR